MKKLLVSVVLLTTACAVPQPVATQRLAAGEQSCIDLDHVTGQHVERGQLIYTLSGGQTVRNVLDGHCPRLNNATGSEITQADTVGRNLCRGDMVRVFDPVTIGVGGAASVSACRVGLFETVASR